jgi:hypothetical protein
MIVITIEGGLVQGVSSDEPGLVGQEVIVIDYDAEGADLMEVVLVPQGDGDAEEATLAKLAVGILFKPVEKFLKAAK